jgi:hypothetical protein
MATLESIEAQITALSDSIDTKLDAIESLVTGLQDTLDSGLYQHLDCALCQGTGEINNPVEGEPGPPYTCPQCSGDGTVKRGVINTTLDYPAYEGP